jgi:hypothetical protein
LLGVILNYIFYQLQVNGKAVHERCVQVTIEVLSSNQIQLLYRVFGSILGWLLLLVIIGQKEPNETIALKNRVMYRSYTWDVGPVLILEVVCVVVLHRGKREVRYLSMKYRNLFTPSDEDDL